MHSTYITANDKHLKVFIAILAILVFLFFPWSFISKVSFPTQFISAHSTEFIFCSATSSSASVNVVGVFNSFLGTDVHDVTRITVGPDTFADISFISPDVVQTHGKRVPMTPMSVSGIGGLAPTISEAVQVIRQLYSGVHAQCMCTPTLQRLPRISTSSWGATSSISCKASGPDGKASSVCSTQARSPD